MIMMHDERFCLFCRIAASQIPAHVVYESERVMAFLDIAPIRPGHTQVIPKDHHRYFDELPPDLLIELTTVGQKIARSLKAIYGVDRVGFAFTGADVPHVHAHVVPLVQADDLTSRRYIVEEVVTYRDPPRPPEATMAETAARIRAALGAG
jgi:histidine triad (HIT) family protein